MLQECEKEQECAKYSLINQITSFLKVQLVLFIHVLECTLMNVCTKVGGPIKFFTPPNLQSVGVCT